MITSVAKNPCSIRKCLSDKGVCSQIPWSWPGLPGGHFSLKIKSVHSKIHCLLCILESWLAEKVWRAHLMGLRVSFTSVPGKPKRLGAYLYKAGVVRDFWSSVSLNYHLFKNSRVSLLDQTKSSSNPAACLPTVSRQMPWGRSQGEYGGNNNFMICSLGLGSQKSFASVLRKVFIFIFYCIPRISHNTFTLLVQPQNEWTSQIKEIHEHSCFTLKKSEVDTKELKKRRSFSQFPHSLKWFSLINSASVIMVGMVLIKKMQELKTNFLIRGQCLLLTCLKCKISDLVHRLKKGHFH